MGSSSGSARNKYMMKMLDTPKCVDGETMPRPPARQKEPVPMTKTAEVAARTGASRQRSWCRTATGAGAEDDGGAEGTTFKTVVAGEMKLQRPTRNIGSKN
jgi:hypothetical protein